MVVLNFLEGIFEHRRHLQAFGKVLFCPAKYDRCAYPLQ